MIITGMVHCELGAFWMPLRCLREFRLAKVWAKSMLFFSRLMMLASHFKASSWVVFIQRFVASSKGYLAHVPFSFSGVISEGRSVNAGELLGLPEEVDHAVRRGVIDGRPVGNHRDALRRKTERHRPSVDHQDTPVLLVPDHGGIGLPLPSTRTSEGNITHAPADSCHTS